MCETDEPLHYLGNVEQGPGIQFFLPPPLKKSNKKKMHGFIAEFELIFEKKQKILTVGEK